MNLLIQRLHRMKAGPWLALSQRAGRLGPDRGRVDAAPWVSGRLGLTLPFTTPSWNGASWNSAGPPDRVRRVNARLLRAPPAQKQEMEPYRSPAPEERPPSADVPLEDREPSWEAVNLPEVESADAASGPPDEGDGLPGAEPGNLTPHEGLPSPRRPAFRQASTFAESLALNEPPPPQVRRSIFPAAVPRVSDDPPPTNGPTDTAARDLPMPWPSSPQTTPDDPPSEDDRSGAEEDVRSPAGKHDVEVLKEPQQLLGMPAECSGTDPGTSSILGGPDPAPRFQSTSPETERPVAADSDGDPEDAGDMPTSTQDGDPPLQAHALSSPEEDVKREVLDRVLRTANGGEPVRLPRRPRPDLPARAPAGAASVPEPAPLLSPEVAQSYLARLNRLAELENAGEAQPVPLTLNQLENWHDHAPKDNVPTASAALMALPEEPAARLAIRDEAATVTPPDAEGRATAPLRRPARVVTAGSTGEDGQPRSRALTEPRTDRDTIDGPGKVSGRQTVTQASPRRTSDPLLPQAAHTLPLQLAARERVAGPDVFSPIPPSRNNLDSSSGVDEDPAPGSASPAVFLVRGDAVTDLYETVPLAPSLEPPAAAPTLEQGNPGPLTEEVAIADSLTRPAPDLATITHRRPELIPTNRNLPEDSFAGAPALGAAAVPPLDADGSALPVAVPTTLEDLAPAAGQAEDAAPDRHLESPSPPRSMPATPPSGESWSIGQASVEAPVQGPDAGRRPLTGTGTAPESEEAVPPTDSLPGLGPRQAALPDHAPPAPEAGIGAPGARTADRPASTTVPPEARSSADKRDLVAPAEDDDPIPLSLSPSLDPASEVKTSGVRNAWPAPPLPATGRAMTVISTGQAAQEPAPVEPLPSPVHELIHRATALEGHGQPLPVTALNALQGTLGTSVRDVRVVRHPAVLRPLEVLHADALTVGDTVVLPGEIDLTTPGGLGVATHEFTHALRRRQPLFVPSVLQTPGGHAALESEETVALAAEHAVLQAPPPDQTPRLPAPWEPMPYWSTVPGRVQTPEAPRPDQWARPTPLPLPPSTPTLPSPVPSSTVHTAQTARPVPAPPPAARKTPDAAEKAVGNASPSPPGVNLDQVALDVYARLRDRLSEEVSRLLS